MTAGGTIGNKTAPGAPGDFVNLGGSGRDLDRPTVTYSPLTGADFIRTMVTLFPLGAEAAGLYKEVKGPYQSTKVGTGGYT